MPQSFLGVNPGTTVKDALEPALMSAETVNNETTTGSWVEVNFPADLVAVMELGAQAASVDLDVEIQGADDTSGTNLVSYGHFDSVDANDDNEDRFLSVQVYKPYVRAVAIEAGSADAVIDKVTLRPSSHWLGNTRTA